MGILSAARWRSSGRSHIQSHSLTTRSGANLSAVSASSARRHGAHGPNRASIRKACQSHSPRVTKSQRHAGYAFFPIDDYVKSAPFRTVHQHPRPDSWARSLSCWLAPASQRRVLYRSAAHRRNCACVRTLRCISRFFAMIWPQSMFVCWLVLVVGFGAFTGFDAAGSPTCYRWRPSDR